MWLTLSELGIEYGVIRPPNGLKLRAKCPQTALLGVFSGLEYVPFGVSKRTVWPPNTARFALPNGLFCSNAAAGWGGNGAQGTASFLFRLFVAMLFSAYFLYKSSSHGGLSTGGQRTGCFLCLRLATVPEARHFALHCGVFGRNAPLRLPFVRIFCYLCSPMGGFPAAGLCFAVPASAPLARHGARPSRRGWRVECLSNLH